MGFKSIIDSIPKPAQKYQVKSKVEMSSKIGDSDNSNNNNREMMRLNNELKDLNKKLEQ